MAVDTQKLFYLLDPVFQIENLAGKPVVGGHIEVFVAGTDTKYITWQDWGGARNPFKIPLRSDGRAVILVEPQYTYDVYVYDSFNNMVCSRLNVSPAIGGDVSVSGLTQVYHDETISGNGTPYEPLGIVSGGKTYEGIEPIVVNNDLDKISANHVPLGVQDPLYFVQDDEEGCIIGIDSSACGKTYSGISPILVDNTANTISITGDIGKDWTEEILSAANDASAAATAWTDSQGYLTGVDLSEYAKESFVISAIDSSTSGLLPTSAFATASGSFITALPDDLVYTGDITGLATTAQLYEKLDKADSAKFYPMEGNPSGFLTEHQSLDDYATKQWVKDKGYLTGVEIPESATWNATTQTVSANSAQWAGGTANPQIPVTGINGIKISESGDKVVFEVSGDYYTNDNPSGFITGVPNTYLQNTDLTITDGKVTEISGVPLSGGGSVDMSAYVPLSSDNLQFGNNTAQTRSFALGSNISAIDNSFALGQKNSAYTYSIALGGTNIAKGISVSVGNNNTAQNDSIVVGNNNSALGYSETIGYYNTSYNNSLTVGQNNSASQGSIAVGSQSKAYYDSIALNNGSAKEGSLAIGGNAHTGSIAIGNYANQATKYSQALGFRVSATNSGMAIGSLNATTTAAFVIGNGSADTSTYPATYTNSDAFIIFHDGSVSAAGKISANGVELGAGGITYTTGSI